MLYNIREPTIAKGVSHNIFVPKRDYKHVTGSFLLVKKKDTTTIFFIIPYIK
jgi:hypothetical protein